MEERSLEKRRDLPSSLSSLSLSYLSHLSHLSSSTLRLRQTYHPTLVHRHFNWSKLNFVISFYFLSFYLFLFISFFDMFLFILFYFICFSFYLCGSFCLLLFYLRASLLLVNICIIYFVPVIIYSYAHHAPVIAVNNTVKIGSFS